MAGLTFHSGRRLADHPELVVAIEQEAAIIDSLAPAGLDVERLFFQAEDVERALKELGPTGTYAEGLVKTAALAAVHVMRGGRLEVAAVPSIPSPANRLAEADQLAQLFHETYERLAPDFGYRTREASAVPWAEVPENNRRLMVATAAAIIDTLALAGLEEAWAEAEAALPLHSMMALERYTDAEPYVALVKDGEHLPHLAIANGPTPAAALRALAAALAHQEAGEEPTT